MSERENEIQVAGNCVYVLNASGYNRWWFNVQPGQDDQGKRITDEECKAIAQQVAARLAAKEEPQPEAGWVSVKDRLPPLDTPVYMYIEAGNRILTGGRGDGGEGWVWCNCYHSAYFHNGIWMSSDMEMDDDYEPSHWMPLPPAPQAGDKP